MADTPQTQAYLQSLGEALIPVAEKMKAGVSLPASRELPSGDILKFARRHIQRMGDDSGQLQDEVNGLGASVVAGAEIASLHRHIGRLERCIENLLEAREEVSCWDADIEDERGRFLLLLIYDHLLGEVASWLDEVIEACTDLEGVLKRRGLVDAATSDAPPTLTFSLQLTAPPEVRELTEWCRGRHIERRQADEPAPPPAIADPPPAPLGFWGHVAAFTLGIGIAEFLFGGDE